MREIERVVDVRNGSTRARALVERVKRAALQQSGEARRPLPFFRDDIDDAAERVRPIEAALRTAEHFDSRNVPSKNLAEIKYAILARIVGIDSIDQHLGVI